jgi:hypothetical protein
MIHCTIYTCPNNQPLAFFVEAVGVYSHNTDTGERKPVVFAQHVQNEVLMHSLAQDLSNLHEVGTVHNRVMDLDYLSEEHLEILIERQEKQAA